MDPPLAGCGLDDVDLVHAQQRPTTERADQQGAVVIDEQDAGRHQGWPWNRYTDPTS